MKIVVLGAGRVGSVLVEELTSEDHDITVIDKNPDKLHALAAKYDIQTVYGLASHPKTLIKANVAAADTLIAMTASDESNILGCQIAYTLFKTPKKIARVRAKEYLTEKTIFSKQALAVDACISPEQLVTNHIERLIEYPGALQVLNFAKGRLCLVAVRTDAGGPLCGKVVSNIYDFLEEMEIRIVAIYRNGRSIPVRDQTAIEIADEVFFITSANNISDVINSFGKLHLPNKKIVIAGGGNIGAALAKNIEDQYQVKLIESNKEVATRLSTKLNSTIVLLGEAQDGDLLKNENIEYTDVFCAVTDDDEANIMSCMQAKHKGVRQTLALINRKSYVSMLDTTSIDVVITPRQITLSGILTHVRHADIVQVYSLRRGLAEAIEVIAHGDKNTSKVVGKSLSEINFPHGTSVCAIVRGEQILFATNKIVVQSDDHLILFVVEKQDIHAIERLFQVDLKYFG